MNDEEMLEEATPDRETALKTSVLVKHRSLGTLSLRPISAETLSYLFEVENLFVQAMKGERVAANNANAVWSIAEFVFIHAGDPDEVAEAVWNKSDFRKGVRAMLSGPLASMEVLNAALPLVEEMVSEYFAAQTKSKPLPGMKGKKLGKALARHGKQAT